MAPEEFGSRRRSSSTPQSIPLQDLNRPPDDSPDQATSTRAQHRRSMSDRGRNLLNRGSRSARYSPIAERSPSPPERKPLPSQTRLTTGGLPGNNGPNSSPLSPIENVGAFQDAIGFAGISFQGGDRRPTTAPSGPPRPPAIRTVSTDSDPYRNEHDSDDIQGYFMPHDDDAYPLTDTRHLSPMTGAEPTTPTREAEGRSSFQSVKFLTPERASQPARLGDDLPRAEAGLRLSTEGLGRSSTRSRSLSPGADSPLRRAGTIMRNISQRVVNLSNENEIIERSLRRNSSQKSQKQAQVEESEDLQRLSHDGHTSYPNSPVSPGSPLEKLPTPIENRTFDWQKHANPLRGKSLGMFPPDSSIRMKLCDMLTHPATEPFLFLCIVLQTVLLAVDSASNVFDHPRSKKWGTTWIDYGLLGLFTIYSLEIIVRVIVSGFIINPVEYSTIDRKVGVRKAMLEKTKTLFAPQRQPSVKRVGSTFDPPHQPSIIRSFTATQMAPEGADQERQQQRVRLAHRAFLRHSFNRLDFVAVVSFWVSFIIGNFGVEFHNHAYVFRMLSCLRILRLLGLTSGTTVILRSLKRAAPLLLNVGFLIGFFWLLFAIIGVQSFKSSLRRTCVWVDPAGQQDNYTYDFQFCGGYLDQEYRGQPWLDIYGKPGAATHKGYLCPVNSYCVESSNPYNGTVSFDNVFQSLELVFVVMTSNTFSDLLYYLADSDYLAAALYFAFGIVIMALWLLNLLIAVITSSFQVIRDESNTSAFTAQEAHAGPEEEDVAPKRRESSLKRLYEKTSWFWVLIITYGLICQCLRSADMSHYRETFIDTSETCVTLVLLFEIFFRIIADWRNFHRSKRNLVDLGLAIITTVIQIPVIKSNEKAYAWLTIFQILRIYRVVLSLAVTRSLVMTVFGNIFGLLNLILFVFLLCFLAAIFAAQIFRGELPQQDIYGDTIEVPFMTIFNSFLGMYQLLSSENWTDILYSVTASEVDYHIAWIGAAFLIIWYILANFIVLNMFIAVIQESFDVSEDEKRLQQVKAFLHQKELGGGDAGNLSLSTIFKLGQATGRRRDPLDYGSAATEMLLKDAVVRDFLDEPEAPLLANAEGATPPNEMQTNAPEVKPGVLSRLWDRFLRRVWHRQPNPFYARLEFSKAYEDLDPRQMAREVVAATERRKKAQREFLKQHPSYNVSLFLFKPDNPIRKICQRIVGPGRGEERIEGVTPSIPVWYAFSAFIYAAIVAMVLLACVTTPVYQREYFETHVYSTHNWFVYTDLGFACLFTVEALIKVIADGFFWTPNAFFRSSWGFMDGIVLLTLWIDVTTSLLSEGDISRAVGAFKALRALRLLNVSNSARDTFHHVIVRGGWKVLSAAFVSLSFLIPFAIYGLNLFNGRMYQCNDTDSGIYNLDDCVGEYKSTPFNWDILAPRQAANPYYDFDNFGDSLFILFQIVSQEGWVDVMFAAESITGVFTQPSDFASQGNAVFFVVFNLLGAVFVLTLFVSVFMRNYTEQTGVAYLTTDQRSWLELRKLLRQISPSKRPSSTKRRETWEEWCYRRAVRKTGRWQRFMTFILVLHLILLCVEFYPEPWAWSRTRDYVFLALTCLYITNIVIRIIGLSWARFRRSSWDVYSVFAVSGTFVTTILLLTDFEQPIYTQLHKLCLVSIALLLIPRNNQLDQLFKTAAASLTSIANLLATWFVLFLVYAIAFTQTFGLTRFSDNESDNVNFRSVPKALILLFRMSSGEGWNQVMEDFANVVPPYCVVGERFFEGDCGSPEWARALFISWNVLSMYIFVNLFVSLIYESFSYVYQRSSGLSVISRDEIRRFKQAWAEFDPNGSGFISKDKFPRLLGELSGVFEMRVYDGDFTVSRLIEDCSKPARTSSLPVEGPREAPEIDLAKLNERLAQLPVDEIRKRRQRINKFYEEVLVGSDPDRGIGFTNLLITLAHYKVINDNKSLRLDEFLRRRARLQRVDEAVRRNVVVGFFDTLYWTRRFRRAMEAKRDGRMTAVPQFEFTVPEIFVDDQNINNAAAGANRRANPPSPLGSPVTMADVNYFSTIDIRSPSPPSERFSMRGRSNSIQVSPVGSRANSIQATPTGSPARSRTTSSVYGRNSPLIRAQQADDPEDEWQFASALGASPTPSSRPSSRPPTRSRANSSVSAQDVLEVLDNSVWGESIRRSFTLKRPGNR
ncbi:calcium channel-like protein subunit Cch1 [Saccharata proteae CBS 121410]|uniref:Calcium-channel protein CCH1 n=1 Tax=Saccharata proteae CBS 121410 TaxID=1314787 RepID=A0A6A5YAH0_9PEZI|nr:calcium channel-like protein subunit Cch1 [Saccharata proteae CBS 121410]